MLERDPSLLLRKLSSFKHRGFWKCMDTIKDKNELNKLWKENRSPWKNW